MKRGFTLVEMLVVIGIIGILIAAASSSYVGIIRKAQGARAQELVHNVQTALEAALQKDDAWPVAVLAEGKGGNGEVNAEVGAALARRGLMSLTYRTQEINGETKYILSGLDRYGVLSPWAQDVVKRRLTSGGVSDSTPVPQGGTIKSHRLRFAVDPEYLGKTQVSPENGKAVTVRAMCCVWCAGYDGVFGTEDDVKSWNARQEEH